jgi:hypothetical protein
MGVETAAVQLAVVTVVRFINVVSFPSVISHGL